jgi:hypothetical protein
MAKVREHIEFLFTAVGIAAVLYLVVALLLSAGQAKTTVGIMALHCLWAARLVLGYRRGRISDRFAFISTVNIPTMLRITAATLIDKSEERYEYWNYILRETFMCAVMWALFLGGIVLPRVLQKFGLPTP